jgi:hypothetical protein
MIHKESADRHALPMLSLSMVTKVMQHLFGLQSRVYGTYIDK